MVDMNQVSMQIILHSGNARTFAMKSMDYMSEFKFDEVDELLSKAKEENILAHRIHTEILQNAIANDVNIYSILFTHAQDTLMAVTTEINIIEKTYHLLKSVDKRIKTIEKGGK